MAHSAILKANSSWLQRNAVAAFFVLAFLLSWYPWFIALSRGRTSGPNPLGPLVAAIILTALTEGWTGLRAFFGRLLRWRVGVAWYLVVFLLPVAVCSVSAAITLAIIGSGSETLRLPAAQEWSGLLDRFVFILLFIGLGEEPGWRGFALPHLQAKHSPLIASLLLASVWTLWHLPLFGNEFPVLVVPAFVVSVFGATMLQTWLFNRTDGSVLLQMILHATVNTVGAGLVFPLFKGSALLVLWWIYSAVWLVLGGILLGRAHNQTVQTVRGHFD